MVPAKNARRTAATTLAMLAITSVLASGCGSKSTSGAQPASTTPNAAAVTANAPTTGDSPPSNATPSAAAPEALQFKASLVGGGELDGSTLAAGQPVLFWFWAPF